MADKSVRDRVRDEVEDELRRTARPLHARELATLVLPRLGLSAQLTPKDLNTALHDDPKARFFRVARATWSLKRP